MARPENPSSRPDSVGRLRRRTAIAVSVALHAALALAAAHLAWRPAALPPAIESPPAVMWLRDWQPPMPPRAEEAELAAMLPPPLLVPAPRREPVPEPRPAPSREAEAPAEHLQPEEAPADAPPAADDEAAPRSEPPADDDSARPSVAVLEGVDWEEERRRAIEQVLEQREREEHYHTFSLADVLEEPEAVPREPGPERSIFTPGAGGRRAPSALRPGQARTRIGRALADLCHALTGGVGVGFGPFALFSACAEDNARSDLFAHLKPEYLKRRPEDFVTRRPPPDLDAPVDAEVRAEVEAAAADAP